MSGQDEPQPVKSITETGTMHVYSLQVVFNPITASVGHRRELGREEVVAMVRGVLRASQDPEEVGEVLVRGGEGFMAKHLWSLVHGATLMLLSAWCWRLVPVSQVQAELMRRLTCPEEPRSPIVNVYVDKNKDLQIEINKVSRQGMIFMVLYARRVEVRGSLVGLAARAVAARLVGQEEVVALGLPDVMAEEVARLLDTVTSRSWTQPI